ncbi:hypothetical protein KSP40_PGU021573 [Platanthera guangdongensis]|uniref:Pollen Ole e 1 allergen and extensin family protein n=1 Tax=Platanthera guangdongensis TaxID=2320717 RepID=A0ABR2ML69_9ASPA
MGLNLLPIFLLSASHLLTISLSLNAVSNPSKLKTNITVIGSVFCDPCSDNTFSKHSYFLQGVDVLIECKFDVNSKSGDEISVTSERTTDSFGVYKLDIPPVEGFQCKQGLEIKSFCRASLIQSSSSSCSIPGTQSSTAHMAVKSKARDVCILNLNTLNFHPAKRDGILCGTAKATMSSSPGLGSSLCFWPFFPPFGFPWPNIPFINPGSLPFSVPSWLQPFLKPPYLPFPFSFPPNSPPAP